MNIVRRVFLSLMLLPFFSLAVEETQEFVDPTIMHESDIDENLQDLEKRFADDTVSIHKVLSEMKYDNPSSAVINLLKQGYSGDMIYLVDIDGKSFVFRIFSPTKTIELREKEYHTSKRSFELGVAPQIYYNSDDFSIIVSEFIEGYHPNTKTFLDPEMIKTYARNLKKLHNGPDLPTKWGMFEYLKRFIPKKKSEQVKLALEKFEEIKSAILNANFPDRPCHNDLHSGNIFILPDNRILFIDWGTAAMRDPFFELARSSMEFIFDKKQEEIFLKEYLGNITEIDRAHYFLVKQLFIFGAIAHDSVEKGASEVLLKNIIRVFETNNFPLDTSKEKITWHDISSHSLRYFLKSCESDYFKEAIELVSDRNGADKRI